MIPTSTDAIPHLISVCEKTTFRSTALEVFEARTDRMLSLLRPILGLNPALGDQEKPFHYKTLSENNTLNRHLAVGTACPRLRALE